MSSAENNRHHPSDEPLAEGTTVSRYRILGKIGAGGMGEVFLAEDPSLERRIALKFLSPQFAADEQFVARFIREARSAAQLSHPNVMTVHEVGNHEGRPFIAMEFVEGSPLNEIINAGDLPFQRIAEITLQIAEGLAAAHGAGIVHRDLKPANVMINREGRAKILDFGLAKRERDEKLTSEGTSLGTLHYLPPEQLTGGVVDQRSDLFSLGVLLYEMVTGRLPFAGENAAQVVYQIAKTPPTPPDRYRAVLPHELRHILSKCLEKNPDLRYQHADELMADLRRLKRELAGGEPDLKIAGHSGNNSGMLRGNPGPMDC